MEDIAPALSELLSLKSTGTQISSALARLNASLAATALADDHGAASGFSRRAFVKTQESYRHNGMSPSLASAARRCDEGAAC
jgi:hypothetical protein